MNKTRAVLQRKFAGKELIFDSFLRKFQVEIIPMPSLDKVKKAKRIIRDPKDAAILASAIEAKPDIFVSGDKDFHTPDVSCVVNVLTTGEALALIE